MVRRRAPLETALAIVHNGGRRISGLNQQGKRCMTAKSEIQHVVPAIGGPDFPRKRESILKPIGIKNCLSRRGILSMGSRLRGNDGPSCMLKGGITKKRLPKQPPLML
jgi:hypothetical protein